MSRVRGLIALASASLMLVPGAASAAPTVGITSVTVSAGTATVSGTASFEAITAPQTVVGENATKGVGTNVQGNHAGDNVGLKLLDASIQPLADGSGLRFTWILESMPPQVPPEGVRYTWAFLVGANMYQLQAKRTNMISVSTLENPVGHVQQLAAQKDFFQLRGACVAEYQGAPVNGCYHLAWLTGGFDIENKKVTMDMPFETKDEIGRLVAPDFKPGAVLVDNGGTNTAGMSIAASFQAAVSNQPVSRWINGWDSYHVGPQVRLGVGPANAFPGDVEYKSAATLSGGTFSGTVGGLAGAVNTVFVRACNGTECSYASFKAL